MKRSILPILIAHVFLSIPASAQELVSASPDITIDLGASATTADEDVAVDNQLGIVLLENLGVIPDASDVIALGLDVNGDRLLAFDTTTALAGGVVARPGDVVRYDGAAYSIEFDATAAGLPSGVATDAVSLAPGGLLLSFDTTIDLGGGLVAADEDLVDWNGSSFAMAFDGSAEGLDPALDVDAAQDLGGDAFAMSFDTTGEIGGVVFDDEDVLRFDGTSWTLEFDASAANPNWAAADLDAVMVPEPSAGLLLLSGGAGLGGLARIRRRYRQTRSRSWQRSSLIGTPAVAIAVASLALATAAFATDGVVEINQTCAVQTGCFGLDSPGFPVVISGSGAKSIRLTSDLITPDRDVHAIVLATDHVTLDLNGFSLRAPLGSGGTGRGITGGTLATYARIRNGSIVRFGGGGISLGGVAGVTVENMTIDTSGYHGIEVGDRARLLKSTLSGNGGIVFGSGLVAAAGALIEGNVASGNAGNGLVAGAGSTVLGNTVYGNGFSGIDADMGSTAQGNTAHSNAAFGLNLTSDCSYRENTISGNGIGIVSGGVNAGGNVCNGSLTCP